VGSLIVGRAAPHETLERSVAGSSHFDHAQLIELDGERG